MKVSTWGHIYQLAFMPNIFPVNCYLIEEEACLTLIDTALPTSHKKIKEVARKIGKPITHIVLTHAHSDHVGSLDALKDTITKVEVSISERDEQLLRGNRELQAGEPNLKIRGGVPKNIRTKPDRTLREGDRIGSLEVLATPGHTPGSISLIDTRTDAVIVGDAFQVRGGFSVSGTLRWTFPAPALATWNKKEAIQSAKKIQTIHPSMIAAGHGKMVDSPAKLLDQSIEDAIRRTYK
ncbi:MBL fold metallo-hydrolase [Geomicrobium sp. JCM 19039]|uniref:MBL fold metallo-hydrolase n=1 Tax=Geomicrobium sp. JCM 19039 TaxID=1460636 RepID=UPI00045F487E|nr:MBL fold metallo-hydrolase [Geomicrobium sp. JCM 19039]GAK13115.1 metallo-beta-lactamase family protein [Geomicrobium sp. JCM 19039]